MKIEMGLSSDCGLSLNVLVKMFTRTGEGKNGGQEKRREERDQ